MNIELFSIAFHFSLQSSSVSSRFFCSFRLRRAEKTYKSKRKTMASNAENWMLLQLNCRRKKIEKLI